VVNVTPGVVYAAFCLMALVVTEVTFREDMQLGLYKNDVTSGVSRTGLYLAKLLTGALLMAGMWLLCSLSCVLSAGFGYGFDYGPALLRNMSSPMNWLWFVWTLMYMALFQAVGVVVKKTVALLVVCVALNAVVVGAGDVARSVAPDIANLFELFARDTGPYDSSFLGYMKLFIAPVTGIVLFTVAGEMLFRRKEL
jgi:hypothetical protein